MVCYSLNIPEKTTITVASAGLTATNRYRLLQQQIVLLFKALQFSFGFLAKNSSCSPRKVQYAHAISCQRDMTTWCDNIYITSEMLTLAQKCAKLQLILCMSQAAAPFRLDVHSAVTHWFQMAWVVFKESPGHYAGYAHIHLVWFSIIWFRMTSDIVVHSVGSGWHGRLATASLVSIDTMC